MNKRIPILFACCMMAVMAWGQSISKQINDIKRSSQYINAEATMETEDQAYKLAEELLSQQITEFASTNESLKKAPNVIVKDVAGKAEKLQMNRGTMTRVFLYVKKSDIIAANNTRVLVQQQNVTKAVEEEATQTEVATEEPASSKKQKKNKKQNEEETLASTTEPVSTPVFSNNDNTPQISASSSQNTVIDNLLRCQQVTEARNMMNRLRVEQKLKRYGAADRCPNPSQCFWLIFNEQGQVVTILGEGESERINYRTNEKDALSNYKGMGAIWFTLTK